MTYMTKKNPDEEGGSRFGSSLHSLISLALLIVVPTQFAYTLLFNVLPKDARLVIAGIVLGTYLIIALTSFLSRFDNWQIPLLIAMIIQPVCWAIPFSVDQSVFDLRIVLRETLPLVATLAILSFPDAMPIKTLRTIAIIGLPVATIMALSGEPYIRNDIYRLYVFTGGEEGLHATAFFIFGNIIIVDQVRRHALIPQVIGWGLIALGIALLWSYKVRTTELMLMVYYLGTFFQQYKSSPIVRSFFYFCCFLIVLGIFAFFLTTETNIGSLGSGRIGAYIHRFDMLANREVQVFLFGSGPGTDLFLSVGWMDKLRDSHNDFIHILVERGIIGLLGVFSFIVAVLIRVVGTGRAIIYAIVVGSIVSNALLSRPANLTYLIWAISIPLYFNFLTGSDETKRNTSVLQNEA